MMRTSLPHHKENSMILEYTESEIQRYYINIL